MLRVGVVINWGAVLVWGLTRTVGIPFVDALSEVEAVGQQDLVAALFAGASVLGALRVIARPVVPQVLTLRWVGVMASLALVAALPALSAEHAHEHEAGQEEHAHGDGAHAEHGDDGAHGHDDAAGGDHAHEEGDAHAEGDDDHAHEGGDAHEAGAAHGHAEDAGAHGHEDGGHAAGDDHAPGAPHDHPDDPDAPHEHPDDPDDPHEHPDDPDDPHEHPDDPDDPDDPHEHPDDPTEPEGPIISIDDPRLSEEEWNAAVALILSTTTGMRPFTTEAQVVAAGYESIGDGGAPGQYEHFVNWSYLTDEFELDPAHIESIVMKMNADGTTRVVSAMYILTLGDTMDDVPSIAGELTTWHDHDNLCFEGGLLVALAVNGVCPLGALVNTPPMLHVWVEANPCGPFAAIDEHGLDCGAPPHEH